MEAGRWQYLRVLPVTDPVWSKFQALIHEPSLKLWDIGITINKVIQPVMLVHSEGL